MIALRSLLLALAALVVLAPGAGAAQLTSAKLTSAKAADRSCHARLYDAGTRGVAQRRVTVPKLGMVQARLSGGRGDWDLAVFNRAGRAVAASSHFGTRELAEGVVGSGQRVTVQACRVDGPARSVRLRVANVPMERAEPGEKVRLARVSTPTRDAKEKLHAAGLDLTEHGRENYLDVVLYGQADLNRMHATGLQFAFLSEDMFAEDRKALLASGITRTSGSARTSNHAKPGGNPALPSGRTNYRRLADYSADLKLLAEKHPELVKPITLPYLTHEGRPVEGVIIGKNPGADDGRPVFFQMGAHHAREWPSAEHAIEFAFDLVNTYGTDKRTTDLVNRTKTIVVPIVNPDGFNLTREVPFANENLDKGAREVPVDSGQPVVDPGFAYKRRNCNMLVLNAAKDGYETTGKACADKSMRTFGVDPNRNYGGLWGGPGATHVASGSNAADTFYGPGPFSEPETQNVRAVVSSHQVTTLITNHTYSDLILRPPGVQAQGVTIDEDVYKAFGAAMADKNGYSNWHGYTLYDTTGTTEDWSYFATGGFGFTFEIGRAAQSVLPKSGEENSQLVLDIAGSYAGVGFHPPYPVGVIGEWNGKGPWTGKGNREAYYTALAATADTAKHSVITGSAEPGSKLTLTKTFATATSPRGRDANGLAVYDPAGTPLTFQDTLTTTLTVGESGTFEWHVNPSTRPAVAKGVEGRPARGPRTADRTIFHDPEATFEPSPAATASGMTATPGSFEDRDFTIAPTEDNGAVSVAIQWPGNGSMVGAEGVEEVSDEDLDLYLLRKNSAGVYEQVANSGSSSGNSEALTLVDPVPGEYKVRVVNYLATDKAERNWSGSITFADPATSEGIPPQTEAWTLNCESPTGAGASTSVVVARGERVAVDLGACRAAGAAAPEGAKGPGLESVGGVLGRKVATLRSLAISRRTVTLTRTGYALVRVACPQSAKSPCSGVLKLRSAKRYRSKGRKRAQFVKLGETAFAVSPGRTGVVKVRVTPAARRFVERRGSVRTLAFVVARDGSREVVAVKRVVQVRAARRN